MAHNNNHNHRANGGGYHEGWKRYREDHRRGYAANGHSANTGNGFGDGASSRISEGRFSGEGSAYGGQQEHRYGRPASSSGNNTPSHASSSSRLPRGSKKPSSNGGQDPFAKQAGVNASGSSSKSLGTSPVSGENPADSGFTKLLHHVDFRSNVARSEPGSKRKNYRVIYDPELDSTLSKGERKSKPKKLRFNGEGLDTASVKDPRKASIAQYFQKPNKASKKFPFKQLPQAKWAFDKDSLGPPPQTELVVWDLPSTVSEVYLANYFRSYGDPIKEMKFINDPINAVPLGVATFKFQGSLDKAMGLAKKLIHTINTDHAKIDGADLRIGLNDHKNELLKRKVDASIGKLKAFKHKLEEEEEKKKRMRRQLLDLEEKKKKEEQQQREKQEKERLEKQPKIPDLFAKYRPNTTTSSIRHNHKIISGTFLPTDLTRYIKDRPYLIIRDKYVSTKRIPSEDIKRVLNKYNWTRVLTDKSGFYVVFNSLKECEKCFLKEDGRKFYEFSMFMELNVPAGYDSKKELNGSGQSTKNSDMDMVNEAANILLKDFQSFLVKDIQERVIAPALLGLLGHEKYPELVEELKRKDAASKAAALPLVNSTDRLKQDALSLLAKQRLQQHHQIQQQQLSKLPSFKRRDELRQKNSVSIVKKKSLIPMQHALNYTNSDVDSGDSGEDDDDDDEETSRSQTPIKRDRGSAATSATEEDVSEPIKKQRKLNKSSLGDAGDEETPGSIDIKMIDAYKDTAQVPEPASKVDDDDEEFDYSKVEAKYQPTPKRPITVYEETAILPNDVFDLETFQSVVKDEEDLVYARKVLADIEQSSHKNVEYWAWKQKDVRHALEEISEDLELITPLVQRLESKTGAFRSEGYRKIPDADKAEYLPHRRKVHKPIKTIQHEGDDDDDLEEAANINSADQSNNKENGSSNGTGNNSNNNNNNNNNNSMNGNIQSSRVNRANNRRFAADITAQLGAETESLSLNALTKRKKPVTFARSSIHNWGLYALEPIAAKEMIIEYVGESIRQQVSDNRERSYLKTGIGSSYLFRVDENTVIDATKKGGIARFINHCCNPSCTAKIIKVEGKKRIVIYALRDIDTNEELTYDYKFERETNDSERIRCLCGAPGCKGYLN